MGCKDRLFVSYRILLLEAINLTLHRSFAGFGAFGVISAWFLLPEIACRTPAEIDELFEKKVNLRHFKGYVTDVETDARAQHFEEEVKAGNA